MTTTMTEDLLRADGVEKTELEMTSWSDWWRERKARAASRRERWWRWERRKAFARKRCPCGKPWGTCYAPAKCHGCGKVVSLPLPREHPDAWHWERPDGGPVRVCRGPYSRITPCGGND